MIGLQREIEAYARIADRNWKKLIAYEGMRKAYCLSGKIEECRVVAEKGIVCMKKCDEAWKMIVKKFSEEQALLLHIINRIQEIDTGKGKENK